MAKFIEVKNKMMVVRDGVGESQWGIANQEV